MVSKPVSDRLKVHWLALFLVLYFALGVLTVTPGHVWGDDWAQYVLHARNLLNHQPYADTGYVFNADVPNVGPPAYPPGLPFLLVLPLAAAGLNLVVLKCTCFLCLVLSLPLILIVIRRDFGRRIAIFATLMFAAHPLVWALRDYIISETPYVLATMLALWIVGRGTDGAKASTFTGLGGGVLLGILVYAAIAFRSIGVSLAVGLIAYGVAQRRSVRWFAGYLVSLTALIWLQKWLIVAPTTYAHELKGPTLAAIKGNVIGYLTALSHLFPLPLGMSTGAAVVVILLAIVGAVGVIVRPLPGESGGRWVGNYVARVPASLWYLVAYLSALVLASIEPHNRYLLPVLPFIFAYALVGAAWLVRLPRTITAYKVAATALALYYVATYVAATPPAADRFANCAQCEDLYAFVRAQTQPGTVIGFAKPRAMALLGGRPSWTWSTNYSLVDLEKKAKEANVGLMILGVPGTTWAEQNPISMRQPGSLADFPGTVLFQNEMFIAYRPTVSTEVSAGT